MILWKILLVSAVILLVNRFLRAGPPRAGRPSTGRPPVDTNRKSIPHGDTSGGKIQRVQCPWCQSWKVSNFRDLRSAYWFLILLTFGLILLFAPVFPRVNVCSDCGKRWSFGDRKR